MRLPDGLVPLPLAARRVYAHAHGDELPALHLDERLNAVAYAIAAGETIFAVLGPTLRPLAPRELAAGFFRKGAAELHFIDERPPLVELAVPADAIERTAKALLGAAVA